jgi:aminoglycoside/choline kinase family phosphotransferase
MDQTLKSLFIEFIGNSPEKEERLTPAGSNRTYYRIYSVGRSIIGVEGTSIDENRAFFSICRQLHKKGLPVPELYAVSDDEMCYLQEDLGDISLFDFLNKARTTGIYDDTSTELLEIVMNLLTDFQFAGTKGMDFSNCYPLESFNKRSILWDLNYFKYCFFKTTGIEFHEDRLENEFEKLADILLSDYPYETFMYRDFQARNVMIHNNRPCFIDFQGGRRGPIEYDLVSFLWQAKAAYPESLKKHLIEIYLESLSRYRKVNVEDFNNRLRFFVLFRTLQVLGAYGFRGNFEHKAHFLQSIPFAVANVKSLLSFVEVEFPYLTDLLKQLSLIPKYSEIQEQYSDKLTVRITSFSFKKGIPEDRSGNGGGFVFDCRSMHNPGLYDSYKQINGTSQAVKQFLEEQGEVQNYLQNVFGLIVPAVDKYMKRGFTNLMVSFGCTGGQHRSVYCAEHLGAYLHKQYGEKIRIIVEHREQKITNLL